MKSLPSKKILEAKQAQLDELTEKVKAAAAGVLVQYQGITVADDTALRAELRKAGVSYQVLKNTMTARACEAAGYGDIKDQLNGMTALAISPEDPIAAAKIIKTYADKIESFQIKAGFVDGGVIDAKGVEALAATPSKEVLIAKMLGSMQSPLYGLAYALQAIIDKSGEAPAEAAEAAPAEA